MDTSEVQQALGSIMSELEALKRRNASLERDVATLRAERTVSPVRPKSDITLPEHTDNSGQGPQGAVAAPQVVSRRWMLRKAGAAAVATLAAATILSKGTDDVSASHTATNVHANEVIAHYLQSKTGNAHAVWAENDSALATLFAWNHGTGSGVFGWALGSTGVWGQSNAAGYGAVHGQHTDVGYGVVGDGAGASYAGVLGRNSLGVGVRGEGKLGVQGKSGVTGGSAVLGQAAGSANGVRGSSVGGYGGHFSGGRAQVRLIPSGRVGRPTSGAHAKGELYMDSAAALYVCAVGGTPGTWRRLTTTTA